MVKSIKSQNKYWTKLARSLRNVGVLSSDIGTKISVETELIHLDEDFYLLLQDLKECWEREENIKTDCIPKYLSRRFKSIRLEVESWIETKIRRQLLKLEKQHYYKISSLKGGKQMKMTAYFHFIYHKCMKGKNRVRCNNCGKPMKVFLGYPYKVILTLQQGKKTIHKYLYVHQKCFSKELIIANSKGMKVKNILAEVYLHKHSNVEEDMRKEENKK